jgi:hypothetical protein
MSRTFFAALALIFAAFAGFELYLNLSLRSLNDDVLESCLKPAQVPKVSDYAVFWFPPGKPGLGVMTNGR